MNLLIDYPEVADKIDIPLVAPEELNGLVFIITLGVIPILHSGPKKERNRIKSIRGPSVHQCLALSNHLHNYYNLKHNKIDYNIYYKIFSLISRHFIIKI